MTMEVTLIHGDLFESHQPVLVCPANEVGTLGAGLAKKFAQRFPRCTLHYVRACARLKVTPSSPLCVEDPLSNPKRSVLYTPTKGHWREQSSLARVRACADGICAWAVRPGVTGIAIPALGCGLGGLSWVDVLPVLEEILQKCPASTVVEVYGPLKSE